jgi:hypothetical protein
MASHDSKKSDEDWVDRCSRNLADAVQRAWPPTREWLTVRWEELVLGAKVMWPWTKYWWRRTDNAVTSSSEFIGRSIREPAKSLTSSVSEYKARRPLKFWGRLLLIEVDPKNWAR